MRCVLRAKYPPRFAVEYLGLVCFLTLMAFEVHAQL
jgi:hypothetical protein